MLSISRRACTRKPSAIRVKSDAFSWNRSRNILLELRRNLNDEKHERKRQKIRKRMLTMSEPQYVNLFTSW